MNQNSWPSLVTICIYFSDWFHLFADGLTVLSSSFCITTYTFKNTKFLVGFLGLVPWLGTGLGQCDYTTQLTSKDSEKRKRKGNCHKKDLCIFWNKTFENNMKSTQISFLSFFFFFFFRFEKTIWYQGLSQISPSRLVEIHEIYAIRDCYKPSPLN